MTRSQATTGLGRGRSTYTRRVLGERKPTEARQKMWASMRVMGTFTCAVLMVVTEVGKRCVQDYVRALELAGFLRCVGKEAGTAHAKIYRLIRNTGPSAPRASVRHGVSDLNTGLFYDRRGNQIEVQRCSRTIRRETQRAAKAPGGRQP